MLIFLIKASVVIISLLGFYMLFLERETFFATNRYYLLACLLFACTLPFIALPNLVANQGKVSSLIESIDDHSDVVMNQAELDAIDDTPHNRDEIIASASHSTNADLMLDSSKIPSPIVAEETSQRGLLYWLLLMYYFGVGILSINLITQLVGTLWKAYSSKDIIKDTDGIIVNMPTETEPCSFFNFIFINPASYDFETYEQIIKHEKIHVSQNHTIDLLLCETAVILLWFNPFVWILRKEVEKNIEYQTDHLLLKSKDFEKEDYQMNLLRIATFTQPLRITTNYNQSLIKKRIIKMNTKKSNNYSYWKYSFIAPVLFILLLALNKPIALVAQNGDETIGSFFDVPDEILIVDHKKMTNTSIPEVSTNSNVNTPAPRQVLDTDCKELLVAIRAQDIEKVRELLIKGNPNCYEPDPGYDHISNVGDEMTISRSHANFPLPAAARTGNLAIGKLLIDAGAKIENHHGMSALSEASYEGQEEFVAYLLGKGADVNAKDGVYGDALSSAASNGQMKIVEMLLAKNADIKASGGAYGSALSSAANNGHSKVIELLLERGVDINLRGGAYGNALNTAANNGHTKTVELLINKGADPNHVGGAYGTALNTAANNGHIKTIELLLEKGADPNVIGGAYGSVLNTAANNGHLNVIELLIEKGANMNLIGGAYGTTLNTAANNGHVEVVELLLEMGADINAIGGAYGTALNTAANNGHTSVVKLLIEKGANVNLVGGAYGSALITAANNGHLNVVKLLVQNGANVNARVGGHGTAFDVAHKNRHKRVVDYLESREAQ